jgi:hypothetical protein
MARARTAAERIVTCAWFAAAGFAVTGVAGCSDSGETPDGHDAPDAEADLPAVDADGEAAPDDTTEVGDVGEAPDAEADEPSIDAEVDDDAAEAGDAVDEADATDALPDGWRVDKQAWLSVTPGYVPGGSLAMLCYCEGELPPPPELVAEEGGCRLTHNMYGGVDLSGCRALDFGEIRLKHGDDVYVLGPSTDIPFPCAFSFGASLPAFDSGDEVELIGTGGSELPAFDVTLVFPPHVALTAPGEFAVLIASEPWETRWDPAIEVHAVVKLPGRHLALRCAGTGSPPLAVPGSLTALWDEIPHTELLNFLVTSEHVIDGDPPLTLDVGCCPAFPTVSVARP